MLGHCAFLSCSVLTSVGCGWANISYREGGNALFWQWAPPPPLFKPQNVQFLLESRPHPSMVSCIHSQRVLIMYQTIMSQCLASRMRKLPLPPLQCYSMQMVYTQVWELDLREHQTAHGLLKRHLYAYSMRVANESRVAQEILWPLEEFVKWDRYKSETHRLGCGTLTVVTDVCQTLSDWRKQVNEITSASNTEFFLFSSFTLLAIIV